jgi:hypothetical protein
MKKRGLMLVAALVALAGSGDAGAALVEVTIEGEVEFNSIGPPPLGVPNPGDPVTVRFTLDSEEFVDNQVFPTRGYVIDPATFSMEFPSVSVGLAEPFPRELTPYFVLRDNDPAVDGFLLTTDLSGPAGVPLDQQGIFGPFRDNFYVTYTGATLSSLDLLDALGVYDFTDLTVFNWTVEDGAFEPLGILFTRLTLALAGTVGEASPPQTPEAQMRATWIPPGRIRVLYTPACEASNHTIYYGPLAGAASAVYSGAVCGAGTSGSVVFVPPTTDIYFLVVGTDGTREGSYGRNSEDEERPESVGAAACDVQQDLAGPCG